ncbi:uncharacterized protein LY89DRAFT_735357 [Mollisia scopiformis]|uniref:Uncharacterized protein n=1 Tax=Mollisia scopiformis TaxID=149040 RepID=A0A194X582_MOLSC|nr:uncharacterized protein LY89DRAFT_735357 [Mollisia scopiformis]KUJ15224.1 hypothetical protein LY89DRAFT_735357 [Mollisia scopiformis]
MARSVWLDLRSRKENTVLQEHHEAFKLIRQELTSPDSQTPQMISLIGGKVKTSLMQDIFAIKCIPGHNKIHLRLAPPHDKTRSPILLADCELHRASHIGKDLRIRVPGYEDQHILQWHNVPEELDASTLAKILYTQVVIPFSTIVCLFADDFGGTKGVAQILAYWLLTEWQKGGKGKRFMTLPPGTYPRVIILQRWQDAGATYDEKLATVAFLREVHQEVNTKRSGQIALRPLDAAGIEDLVKENFGDICLLALPNSAAEVISLHPYLEKLHRRILHESENVQILRRAAKISFTATHLEAFFSLACKHFANTIEESFCFVKASRIFNPPSVNLATHVSALLKLNETELHIKFAAPVIASAICLDSLTPQMHQFDAQLVFDRHYADALQKFNTTIYIGHR